jgi:hypothetical protein
MVISISVVGAGPAQLENKEIPVMSSFRIPMNLAAGAALMAAIGVAGTPAHASITHNALTANGLTTNALTTNALNMNSLTFNALNTNALTAGGSAIDDLNGVAVEAVTASEESGGPLAFNPQPDPPGLEDW